jgi:hypothetical protein
MAVIVRPRDLYYDKGKVEFKLERETEKERQEREEAGLDNLTSETAKMFLLEVRVDKKAISSKQEVVYIDNITFLVQTLQIKIQFTHFLKVLGFMYNMGKTLNMNVTKVHFIFEQDQKYF